MVDPSGQFAIVIFGVAIGVYYLALFVVGALALTYAVGSIAKTIDAARPYEFPKTETETIAKTQTKTKTITKIKDSDPRIHHIVAQGATNKKAAPAQAILRSVGMSLQDSRNLVVIPQRFHVRMHTKAYYTYVNEN